MTTISPFPVVSQAQAGSMLRALALAPGQVLEGRVLGPGLDGATLVQVGRQAMSLSLPQSMQVGTLLSLGVQHAEGGLRLTLLGTRADSAPAAHQPATSVEISQRPSVPQGPLTYGPPVAGGPGAAVVVPGTAGALAGVSALAGPAAVVPGTPAQSTSPGAPVIAPPSATMPAAGPVLQQRPGASPYGMPGLGNMPSGAPPSSAPPPGAPLTPQAQALAHMVQQALPGQGSLGAVTGLLAVAIGRVALPEPVLKAARQILGNQLVGKDGKIDAAALKAAIRNSGIFQEASLAGGLPAGAASDTKSGLLALRQNLGQWLGNQAQIAQVAQLPPPLRHVLPRARLPDAPPVLLPADAEEVGRLLLERTDSALSRLRLHQHASLPDSGKPGESQWSMDLPLAMGAYQTVINLQIHHDAEADASRPEERGWQVRFAVNLPELGEVGAQISLRGQLAGIMLWADRDETADAFTAGIEDLRGALETAGLRPGAIVVRHGPPGDTHAPAGSGQFLDATR